MALLTKNGVRFSVRDKNHLSAFLNNGWIVDEGIDSETSDCSNNCEKNPNMGFLDVEDLKSYTPEYLKLLAVELGVEFTEETTHEELAELCSKVEVELPKNEDTKKYSKSDISRMKLDDLKTLAPTLGIEVTEESTGAKLKEEIIAKLGL